MKILSVKTVAGSGTPVAARGRYFRILDGAADFYVTFRFAGGKESKTLALVGIGCEFPVAFESLMIESTISQTVQVAYSEEKIDDSRLVGSVSASIAPATAYGEEITAFLAATATKVVSSNGNRKKATLTVSQDGRLWHDNTVSATKGLPVSRDTLIEVSNTAELYFYSALAGSAHLLEEQ